MFKMKDEFGDEMKNVMAEYSDAHKRRSAIMRALSDLSKKADASLAELDGIRRRENEVIVKYRGLGLSDGEIGEVTSSLIKNIDA